MKRQVVEHFKKVDPILYSVIDKIDNFDFAIHKNTKEYFTNLCREIIGQQLSGKVVQVIFDRFVMTHPNKKIIPQVTAKISDEDLRKAGMSWSKVSFIKDLANKVVNKEVYLENLDAMSDEEVVTELTKIKGIGPWTAEMFLMFTLNREDVFSTGDLGLRNAIHKLYELKQKPTKEKMLKLSQKWSPYRTYACRILWKSLEL